MTLETNESNVVPLVTGNGHPMFTIEIIPNGVLLKELTTHGIINHEFESMTQLELWVIKYRGYNFA